jgi:hypothetical protein
MRRRIDTLRKSFILIPKRTSGTQPMQFRPELVLKYPPAPTHHGSQTAATTIAVELTFFLPPPFGEQ